MNKLNVDHYIPMEQPFIMIPFELMKKNSDASYKLLNTRLKQLRENAIKLVDYIKDPNLSKEEKLDKFDKCIKYLKELKSKLNQHREKEINYIESIKKRINHLDILYTIPTTNSPTFSSWSKMRVDRVILDYLLREGFHLTAKKFALETNLNEVTDFELFEVNQKVEIGLKNKRCKEALEWCKENKSALTKMKSDLEFQLRLQEYVELIRQGKTQLALKYATQHLQPYTSTHLSIIKQYTTLIAFHPNTHVQPYATLFSESQWEKLILSFREAAYNLLNTTAQPALIYTLQAGLSALKTQFCKPIDPALLKPLSNEVGNPDCPTCQPEFASLAKELPMGMHSISSLKCRLSGAFIDEGNPPMALPNGKVYSYQSILEQSKLNENRFTDPDSGEVYTLNEIKKVFIT